MTWEEINEILDIICFAERPFETRIDMCAALVREVRQTGIIKERRKSYVNTN